MYGYISDDYWCDIGDLKAYSQAHQDILEKRVKVSIPGKEIEDGVWVGENCIIDDGASIEGPCIIGTNTKVKKRCCDR